MSWSDTSKVCDKKNLSKVNCLEDREKNPPLRLVEEVNKPFFCGQTVNSNRYKTLLQSSFGATKTM